MQRAVDSSSGLPSISTSTPWMLAFLTPADVRRSFRLPPFRSCARVAFQMRTDPYAMETGRPSKTHRCRQIRETRGSAPSGDIPERWPTRGEGSPALAREEAELAE